MSKTYLGIDPGLNGGITIIENGKIVHKIEMPQLNGKDLDDTSIFDLLDKYTFEKDCYCVIEKVHGMRHWGIKNNFSFGGYYRVMISMLKILEIPFTEVQAKKWQKEMFEGIKPIKKNDGKADTKKMADFAIRRIFPSEDFRHSTATSRAKKFHDGIVDATLIATYASRNF